MSDSPDPVEAARSIDLGAARAARRETQGPPPTITFLGDTYTLPHGAPAEVIEFAPTMIAGGPDATSVVIPLTRLLLGGDNYDVIIDKAKAAGDPLEVDDVLFLMNSLLAIYKVSLPESSASAPTSSDNGSTSRPTSTTTTDAT